jgi:hypothetical protein
MVTPPPVFSFQLVSKGKKSVFNRTKTKNGAFDGARETDGTTVGPADGVAVGIEDGSLLGFEVGTELGLVVGSLVRQSK